VGQGLKYIDEGVPPQLNAAKPAGEWQTLRIVFKAPRFDRAGQKTENARFVSVTLNGQLIHQDVEVDSPTGNASTPLPEVAEAPLFLQLDHGAVAFRKVRVRPLKTSSNTSADKLNFVFILVDDLGCRDLGYEGSTFHETPHIDALAESGMRFDQGYAACRVCSPSRASIMLGKATPRHGITDWIGAATGTQWNRDDRVLPVEYVHNLPQEDTTLAEAFRDGGYQTFFAGKWHLGSEGSWPEDHGFMINKGGWNVGSPGGGYFAPWNNPRLESGPDGESLTLRLANETAAFIDANQDKPFLAYLSFYTVHGPIQTTEELCNKYRDKAKASGLTENESRFQFRRRLPVRQVQDNPIYAGMVEMLDTGVGIVMDKLTETGLDKNTVVIFTSDNGGVSSGDSFSTSLLPFRGGKGMQWEGGIREPYIIHVPGLTQPGSSSQVPAIGMDFYPTMLELAGLPLKPEQHVDGVSLVPLLKGKTIAERDLFWHYPHYGNQGGEPSSIIRSNDWKLIYYHEDGRSELYDLATEIGEESDVASQHPETVAEMKKRLDAWLSDTSAKIPQPDPRFTQEKFDARLKRAREVEMPRLETQHADYLDKNKKPSPDWWGSATD
jgi:arylsulfatase A-like enzyme